MKNRNKQSGQSLVEYVILVALIGIVCISSTKTLGRKINTKITEIERHIDSGIPVNLSPGKNEDQ